MKQVHHGLQEMKASFEFSLTLKDNRDNEAIIKPHQGHAADTRYNSSSQFCRTGGGIRSFIVVAIQA